MGQRGGRGRQRERDRRHQEHDQNHPTRCRLATASVTIRPNHFRRDVGQAPLVVGETDAPDTSAIWLHHGSALAFCPVDDSPPPFWPTARLFIYVAIALTLLLIVLWAWGIAGT